MSKNQDDKMIDELPAMDTASHKLGLAAEATSESALSMTEGVFDALIDGLIINAFDGTIVAANEAICQMHGYSRAELLTMDPRDFIDPAHHQLFEQYLQKVSAGEPFRCIARDVCKDGALIDVEVRGSLINYDGQPHVLGVVRDITAQKRTEALLRASEARYVDLFENAPDMIVSVDARDATILECNRTLSVHLGYEKGEIIGRSVFALYDPACVEEAKCAFELFTQTGSVRDVELCVRKKDGTKVEVSVSVSAVRDEQGNILRSRSVWRDITDRKEAEARQLESEKLFHTIFEFEPECVKLLDHDANLLDMNPAGLSMIEVDAIEQVRGKPIISMIVPEHREEFKKAVDDVFAGSSRRLQFEIVGRRGTRRWMESHQVPLRNAQGEISSLLAVTQDITQRKRAERTLAGGNRVLEQLATGSTLDAVLTTLVSEVEAVQPMMVASVLRLDANNCLRHGVAPSLPEFYNRAVDGLAIGPEVGSCGAAAYLGERVIVEDVLAHPFWADFRELATRAGVRACWSEPLRSAHGEILGTFAMYYREPRGPDESDLELIRTSAHLAAIAIEHKQAEEELLQAHAELEQRVQERTEDLERANAALKQSNQNLQDFAYVASHDLQEPLRMVTSYCQLLQRRYQGKLDKDADEFIHFAVDGATRMGALISDLLTYSRVETDAKPPQATDCQAVMDAVVRNLHTSIHATGATVIYNELPTVMADGVQLTQILQNLVDNAIKYHGHEPPEVHVTAARSDHEWRFAVRDNGVGIDPKNADHIFAVFKRLHSREHSQGTGLGLAICKRAVSRHGGRIWVESQPGQGSTFLFTLPTPPAEMHDHR